MRVKPTAKLQSPLDKSSGQRHWRSPHQARHGPSTRSMTPKSPSKYVGRAGPTSRRETAGSWGRRAGSDSRVRWVCEAHSDRRRMITRTPADAANRACRAPSALCPRRANPRQCRLGSRRALMSTSGRRTEVTGPTPAMLLALSEPKMQSQLDEHSLGRSALPHASANRQLRRKTYRSRLFDGT